ncbi:MAG: tRNA (adenosine(37)-N6)-threonylcarbamoyltransferase complex transferase subunit TsaD, partial [Candidatus Nealsonbacteria bacterium CG_4_10_14_0_2_um_filter_37_10]
MKILGIDTSCDDTCVALLEIKDLRFKILNNVVSSQVKLHAKYGGVYPFLAKREHQKNLPIVFKKAIKGIDILKIDLIGVTVGPGLEPCLWQGVNFAKDLAEKLKKPLVSVNHIEAHIVANFLNLKSEILNLKFIFPAVCLVVSGGHTQLILMKAIGKYKLIGETRDDAAGECFDKVARILGLGYPGGPAIDAEAATLNLKPLTLNLRLPRPMIYQKNYDFSFSGLKTAVLYDFRKQKPKIRKSREYIREMCREAQQAIIDVLIRKTIKAAKDYKAKSIILGGGVAANDELRRQFAL